MKTQNHHCRATRRWHVVVTCLFTSLVLVPAATVSAAITPLHSSLFGHLYEGDAYPLPGYTEDTAGGAAGSLSSDGALLKFAGGVPVTSYIQELATAWPGEVSGPVGVTVEARLKMSTGGSPWDSLAQNQFVDGFLFIVKSDGVYRYEPAMGEVLLAAVDNTDGFHTFRYARDGGSTLWQVWRDEVQIGTDLPSWSNYAHSGIPSQLNLGRGNYYPAVGPWDLDYFRWTADGGFSPGPEPVPEPATVSLIAVAVATGLARRKFQKK